MDNACDLRFYDEHFNWIYETKQAESVQLWRELYGPGKFEIHIHPDKMGDLTALKRDNIVIINKDAHKSGIVRDFYVSEKRGEQVIVIYGETGAGITKQRVTVPPSKAQDPGAYGWDSIRAAAETVIKHYAKMNLAAPYDAKRKIPNLITAPDEGRGMELPWRSRYTRLDEELYNIASYAEMGYEIYADFMNSRWVFDVIPGVDRTRAQEAVSPVTFKMEYQNVDSYKYIEDYQNYKNTAYAGGAGEDENRFFQVINADNTGLQRHEVFLDCGNIAQGNVSELLYYGNQKLNEYKEAKTIEVSALPSVFTFEEDYFLGDKVTVLISRLGITLDTRITATKDVWERATGHTTEVRFGGRLPNLFTILSQSGEVR